MRATWSLTEDFCRSMLLLHWQNWRKISDIKEQNTDATWTDLMLGFLQSDQCSNFVKTNVKRAKQHNSHVDHDQMMACNMTAKSLNGWTFHSQWQIISTT